LRFSTLLLILSIVFAIASIPSSASQTFTTETNVMTTTGLFTSAVYSTNTVGTTTQTIVSSNTFISTTDILASNAGRVCTYDPWNITVDPGTIEVTGTIGPPSSRIDFYIMNQNQFYAFSNSLCGNIPYAAEVAVYGLISTYSLDWKNPPTGWYYFIFSSTTLGASVPKVTTPFVLVATFNQEQTSTVYNMVTNQVALTATQTVSSTQITQAVTGLNFGVDPTIIVAIVVVVIVIIAALYVVRSRPKVRKSRAKSSTSNGQFCLNCGKALPTGSKFCNKCGTPQE